MEDTRQGGGVWRALETGKLCKLVGKLIFEQTSEESKEALASCKTSSDTCPGRMVRLCSIGRVEGGRDRPGAQILAAHSEGAAGAG